MVGELSQDVWAGADVNGRLSGEVEEPEGGAVGEDGGVGEAN